MKSKTGLFLALTLGVIFITSIIITQIHHPAGACGFEGGYDKAVYSTNGIKWKQTTLPEASWYDVCYGNGKFVVVGSDYDEEKALANEGDGYIGIAAYSTDGIKWKKTTMPVLARRVCYGDGKFVATIDGGKIAYSVDGIKWKQPKLPDSMWVVHICYGNGKFVATSTNSGAYSTDGIKWKQTTLPEGYWYGVCYGNGKFAAVGEDYDKDKGVYTGIAAYSADGINWKQATIHNAVWQSVCYGNGKFIAVGKCSAAYSTDGINWKQAAISDANWSSVCYGNGKFVASALGYYSAHSYTTEREKYTETIAAYSTDGINWKKTETIIEQGCYFSNNRICYGKGKFIIVDSISCTP